LDAIAETHLVSVVRSCFFDFRQVATRITEAVGETDERSLEVEISAEGCRRRYEGLVRKWRRDGADRRREKKRNN